MLNTGSHQVLGPKTFRPAITTQKTSTVDPNLVTILWFTNELDQQQLLLQNERRVIGCEIMCGQSHHNWKWVRLLSLGHVHIQLRGREGGQWVIFNMVIVDGVEHGGV